MSFVQNVCKVVHPRSKVDTPKKPMRGNNLLQQAVSTFIKFVALAPWVLVGGRDSIGGLFGARSCSWGIPMWSPGV
jgi:hypothetical protein